MADVTWTARAAIYCPTHPPTFTILRACAAARALTEAKVEHARLQHRWSSAWLVESDYRERVTQAIDDDGLEFVGTYWADVRAAVAETRACSKRYDVHAKLLARRQREVDDLKSQIRR